MKHFFFSKKAFYSTVFALVAVFFTQSATAQSNQHPTFEAIPEANFFPNPVAVGGTLKLQLLETSANERAVFSVKIISEKGQTVFAAEMPDELELLVDGSRFKSGLFIAQFYEDGRLFEQAELIVQ